MRIAAAMIELHIHGAGTIKTKRSVANSLKTRLRQRFNISTAEVADHDDLRSLCLGCVMVGVDARHLQKQMEKAVRYVEGLGLAEVVADDVQVLRLDELEVAEESGEELPFVPPEWSRG